ncbi:MAG: hypothetical protein ABL907_02895 [Hyphomicrobium sp.]
MSDSKNDPAAGKRPYATLDLKATEIKVTSIGDKSAASTQTSAATGAKSPAPAGPVPGPAAAATYASATATHTTAANATTSKDSGAGGTAAKAASPNTSTSNASPSSASSSSASSATAGKPSAAAASTDAAKGANTAPAPQTVIIKKRGGFFSHMAASVIGGGVALGAWAWGLPELNNRGLLQGLPFDVSSLLRSGSGETGALTERLAKIEKLQAGGDLAAKLQTAEARLAALEKSTASISDIKEQQARLVAETKAAMASLASDAGAPDQIERLTSVEGKLKAMTEAGANNPNAGRMEQLAALTGKVADLETSMATQLTALRKSVAGDVEARIVAATESAEAAKSGTQRIDRDISGLKSDAVRLDERLATVKGDADRAGEQIKRGQDELAALKSALEGLKSTTAKPADVASAIGPVSTKIATIEQDLKAVVKAEEARRSNAERVVLALELQNLKRALDRGQKYDIEFAEVEKASGGKLDLAPLSKFKEQGVPTLADLSRAFKPSANAMIDAESDAAAGGVVDRLIAGAKSVVRVRKVSHEAGDTSAEAVAARMEAALKEGRLGDVVNEANALSPKAKDAAQPFIEKVSARASVDSALASLEGQLKSSLSGAPSEPVSKTQ